MNLIKITDCEKAEIEIPVGNYVTVGLYAAKCVNHALSLEDKCRKCDFSNGLFRGCDNVFEHVAFLCESSEREDGKNVFFEKFVGSVE